MPQSGAIVYTTDMHCTGKVIKPSKEPRSCLVNIPKTKVRRNRVQLRNIPNDVDKQKPEIRTPSSNVNSRPRRIKKLSFKARENPGLK